MARFSSNRMRWTLVFVISSRFFRLRFGLRYPTAVERQAREQVEDADQAVDQREDDGVSRGVPVEGRDEREAGPPREARHERSSGRDPEIA